MEVKEILVPIDFSEVSDEALEFAKVIAEKFQAELHVLHVVEDPILNAPTTSDAFRDERIEKCTGQLDELFDDEDRQRFHVIPVVRCGPATETILEYVSEKTVDLIVMGAKGRSALASMLMGSVAEDLMKEAPCPVVTVRQPHPVEDPVED